MKSLKEVFGYSKKTKKSKKLSTKQLRTLLEGLIAEDADPKKMDMERFPLELSKAAAKKSIAPSLVTAGGEDGEDKDDVVGVKTANVAVSTLKPSQSSMNIEKACQFAICAILKVKPFPTGPGGDLGAIVTQDDHIMDGHHRWIASGMVDPSAKVGGFRVAFPAKQMIAALNMITVGLGITKGKPGSGGFDQFNASGIKTQLDKLVKEGFWGADAEQCQEACETFSGEKGEDAVAAAAKKMGENVSSLTLEVPDGFPERPDMPVISKGKGHLAKAVELLQQGKVDLNEPYADPKDSNPIEIEKDGGKEKQKESARTRKTGQDLLNERWLKNAGLLK